MKKYLTIVLLLISLYTIGQAKVSSEDSVLFRRLMIPHIDTSKYQIYQLQVQKLSRLNNVDSVREALRIMYELCRFLPQKFNTKTFFNELDEIDSFKLRYASSILGNWKSEILGNNWGFFNKNLKNPNRRAIFTDSEVLFYLNDTLIRKTYYKIVFDKRVLGFDNFLLEFADSKQKWAFYLIPVGEAVPFHENAKKIHLFINKQPNCLCGCPEELYSKDDNYPITFLNF